MVAKTSPGKEKRMAAAHAAMVRETVKKVDKCVARLLELQYAVSGGSKTVAGVRLSPRSTRGYLRVDLRCKQETVRMKNAAGRRSPAGKFPEKEPGDWRRMSLPAMLLGETISELLQTSQMAKEVVAAASRPTTDFPTTRAAGTIVMADPKTPVAPRRGNSAAKGVSCEITDLRARRCKEKQPIRRTTRSEAGSPPFRRVRSRISFKPASSPPSRGEGAGRSAYKHLIAAQRVSPRNRPWAKKTVLFPNPVFSSPSGRQQKFCRTGSPVIGKERQNPTTPHRFLIKSPPSASKTRVRVVVPTVSPTRISSRSRPRMTAVAKLRRSLSPARIASRLVSPLRSRSSYSRREPQNGRR